MNMFMLRWEGPGCSEHSLVGELHSLKALWDLLNAKKLQDTSSLTSLHTMEQFNTKRAWPETLDGAIMSAECEPLLEGREHLTVSGLFRSDKYDWSEDGFLPLRIGDSMAWPMLRAYADSRREKDAEFSRDLHAALDNVGAPPSPY